MKSFEWTIMEELDKSKIPEEVRSVLIEGEEVLAAYKTIRDVALITNKRIILADKEGLRGKKVEIYSIPYRSIDMYSSENAAGLFDFDAEMEFWLRGGAHLKLKILKKVDIRAFDRLISSLILK